MNETQAIQRLKSGDIDGLKPLVEQYQLRAVRTAYFITQDYAMAEDIVQTAFLRSFERIGTFDVTRRFEPWFLRLVINDAIKAVQQRQRHISLEAISDDVKNTFVATLAAVEVTTDERVEQSEVRLAIRTALQRLSPIQRAVIVQRYYLEWSEGEMAYESECPPGTIKSRLHAARSRLRLLLKAFHSFIF